MKLKSILATSLFAATAILSAGAYAATDTGKGADAAAPATDIQTDKKVKPHSHVEEKTGVPQKAPSETAPARKNAAKDKSKHYHPRDMK
ncbi:MAG: hypothetical protein HZB64_06155 [Rhodocyclales bacterium]|nr:hypothetical protein [Rhodocyclales bacterium]